MAHRSDASPTFLEWSWLFYGFCIRVLFGLFFILSSCGDLSSCPFTLIQSVRRTASISEHSKACLRPVDFATPRSPLCRRALSRAPLFVVRFVVPFPDLILVLTCFRSAVGKMICQIGQKDFAGNRVDGEASASSTKAAGFSQPPHPVAPE